MAIASRMRQLVANPGCYATSVILALAPLLKAGVVDRSTGSFRIRSRAFRERGRNRRRTRILYQWPTTFRRIRFLVTGTWARSWSNLR